MRKASSKAPTIEIVEADITTLDVDAVVNAANNRLWMGAGVAGAIKRVGGAEIEREAMAQGPIPIGEAVVTSGGNLIAKYVIHAAAMGENLVTDVDKIRAATTNALKRARENNITSIAFPALGTGVGGFAPGLAAHTMIEAALDFVTPDEKHPWRVLFALVGPVVPSFVSECERLEELGRLSRLEGEGHRYAIPLPD